MSAQKPSIHELISHYVWQSRNQAQSIVPAMHPSDDRAVLSIQTDDLSAPIAVQSTESSHFIHPLANLVNPVTDNNPAQSGISAPARAHRPPNKRPSSVLSAAPSPIAITIKSVLHLETTVADSRIRKTIELIRESLHLPISLEKLARQVKLSASRLRNLFCQVIGIPIAQFIRSFRLENARQLLQTESLTIKEVMDKTGIHDPSHFNRDFKSMYGVTPAQYRNQFA